MMMLVKNYTIAHEPDNPNITGLSGWHRAITECTEGPAATDGPPLP